MRLKDFSKKLGFFEYQNEKTGMIYKFDQHLPYNPFVLMDKNRRIINYFPSQEKLVEELKKYDIEGNVEDVNHAEQ